MINVNFELQLMSYMIGEQKVVTPKIEQSSEERIEQSAKMTDLMARSAAGTEQSEKFQELTNQANVQEIATKAINERNNSHKSISMRTDIRQFKQYGPSVYLLFAFLKKAMILFSILAALSLILIFYNFAVGETFPIKAKGVAIAFARASLGSLYADDNVQYRTKMLYEIIVVLIMITFFCFWLYWRAEVSSQSTKMERELQLPNLNVVVVEGKGIENANRDEVEDYMAQFGVVKEVVRVRDLGESVAIACEIYGLEKQIKELNEKIERKEVVLQRETKKVEKKYKKIEQLGGKLKEQQKNNEGNKNLRYFVELDSQSHQKNAIDQLKKAKPCCGKLEQGYQFKGEELTIKRCQAQPWGIYWQNQHVGLKQQILPNILLFFMINLIPMVSILLLGLVSTMAEPVYFHPFLQSNNLPENEIIYSTNSTIIGSWCIGNHYSSAMQSICTPYMNQLSSRAGIYLAISLCLALSQYFMRVTIVKCSKYFRFKDHAEKSHTIMMHLFMNYTVVYVVIALSVQTSLFGAAMNQIMANFISIEPVHSRLNLLTQYFDYIPQWYADYGFQLVLNYLTIIILPYSILPFIYFISRKIKLYFANSRLQSPDSMKKIMQLEQFQLEQHYASTFMSITVGMVFAGGMPIMFTLILASLILRYFSMKYLFIYANRPPPITDRLLAKATPALLIVAIIAYSANTTWALGVEQIFTPKTRLFQHFGITSDSNAHTVPEALLVFLRRACNTWIIPFVFALGVILIIFRKRLSNTWLKILRTLRIRQRADIHKDIENNIEMHSMQSQDDHMEKSYEPYNHQYYRHIFQIIQ